MRSLDMRHTSDKSDSDVPSSLRSSNENDFSNFRLFALTSGLIGLQFCWAVQIGYITKSLLELGLSERFVSYAWLAGPIAGIVVQPTVGILSDRCTSRYGRRRPFLVAGTVLSVISIILFAYAAQIGHILGDPPYAVVKPRALTLAIAAFWALDFSINAAQGPLRTLLADVVPPSQHKKGNAYFALATGIGNCSGSLLGSLRLTAYLPFFPGDLQALYTFAAVILIITMTITVVFTKETSLIPRNVSVSHSSPPPTTTYESVESQSLARPRYSAQSSNLIKAARKAPHPFWPTFTVQCFIWFGWFTLYVFGTSWVGAEVYNGSFDAPEGTPSRDLYDAGVRVGNFGLALQSVVTVFISLFLPYLIVTTSAQFIYAISSILFALALSSAITFTQMWQAPFAVIAFASTGFAWAVTMTIPWAIMGEAVAKHAPEKAGVYFTLFNLSQCIPEVVVSLVAEEVVRTVKRQAAVLNLGGISVFIAVVLIIILQIGVSDNSPTT